MPDGSAGFVFNRFAKIPPKPWRRIIYTGHPPVLEQIANQVRSPGGFTYGVATPEGAKLATAFGPKSRIPEKSYQAELDVYALGLRDMTLEFYKQLRAWDAAGADLPPAGELYSRFGSHYRKKLEALERADLIEVWTDVPFKPRAIAIRLEGSGHVMRTPDAPPVSHIRFS